MAIRNLAGLRDGEQPTSRYYFEGEGMSGGTGALLRSRAPGSDRWLRFIRPGDLLRDAAGRTCLIEDTSLPKNNPAAWKPLGA